ncbi:hypothetical protein CTAYLR_006581 [Chrysophaeum taylorii]|uniref:G8 domain-containing protein n=1 Tax=Chrysophaeum taylorii TaxID=2483200 RepID=A0AAD7UNT4_9STRA|nr:hypothetical protein CTAYLR_006581 [Chrysophaeum taylorii]
MSKMLLTLYVLVVRVAAAGAQCVVESSPPGVPVEDSSIQNPSVERIITRDTNSELVDLGHPGHAWAAASQSNCPHDWPGLEMWEDQGFGVGTGQDVQLAENKRIIIACNSIGDDEQFGVIRIPSTSELIIADEPISLNVRGIRVYGALRAGSETCRLNAQISITLRGNRPSSISDTQNTWFKGIDVNTGTIDIHAAEYYQTWSRLAVAARAGDNVLFLQDKVNWEAGMSIVLTTTQLKDARDFHQNEVLQVVSVKGAGHLGTNVTAAYVTPSLKYDHWAGDEYQPEVGLLSRRFKIQGDSASEPSDTSPLGCSDGKYASYPCENHNTGFGGHVIVQNPGAVAKISGVEFYRMGQTNFEGRYPIHWHLTGDAPDSYVQDSSFHRSFFKCVTLHGANKVRVSRNVAFDIIGHCVYLEDGVEKNNVIEYNMAAHVHPMGKPPGAGGSSQGLDYIYDSETLSTAADATASGFYISNAYNRVRGNAAVGGYAGYQFPIFEEPLGLHRDAPIYPRMSQTLEFDGNSCRSSGFWWGHAGCIYVGGEFRHLNENSRLPMRYNPGRTINGWRSCEKDDRGSPWCDRWDQAGCSGTYPVACFAYLVVTNFKASLTSLGLMNWGNRARMHKIEVHDFVGGPAAELFGDNDVDQILVTCRTENFPSEPTHCGTSTVEHEGHQAFVDCERWDKRAWEQQTKVITWYDTNMNTVVTNATVRSCDPTAWENCKYSCEQSSVFQLTAHSDQFLPEFMSLTADFRFEKDTTIRDHVVEFSTRSESISGRFSGWLDVDGTACLSDKGPMVIGSNNDAGQWWRLDEDCETIGLNDLMWCCQAKGRWLASFSAEWDSALTSQLAGEGGTRCNNDFAGGSPCDRVGFLSKFGDTSLATQAVKIMERAEVVGAVPGSTSPEGFGWYLWLDKGAPRLLTLKLLQVHHDARLVLAITYPKGTTFTITMEAVSWCNPERDGLCEITYDEADSLAELLEPAGSKKYYVKDHSDASTLFLRVVQRRDRRLGKEDAQDEWDDNFQVPLFTNNYLERLHGPDMGLPYRFGDPQIHINANCPGTGAYCQGGAQPQYIPQLLWSGRPTPRPTSRPTVDRGDCVKIVDGAPDNEIDRCPNSMFSDTSDADVLVVDPDEAVAGIRCCDDEGNGYSYCEANCQLVAFQQAKATCESHSQRLCTPQELLDGKTDGTGCLYDSLHVWTSERTDCPKRSCATIVDGYAANERENICPNTPFSDVMDPDVLHVASDTKVAGVRCCDDAGGGKSMCETGCEVTDLLTANARCEAEGMRLCTTAELLSGQAAGTGCNYDSVHVWSSDAVDDCECKAIVDGNKDNEETATCANTPFSDAADPDVMYVGANEALAGVRCCDEHGGAASPCDAACELVDFATAQAKCDAIDMRLCTTAEILSLQTVGTGCLYDFMHVWAAESMCSPPTPRPSFSPTLRPSAKPTSDLDAVCLGNWQQCGHAQGLSECCASDGYECYRRHALYSQCRPSCPDETWSCWYDPPRGECSPDWGRCGAEHGLPDACCHGYFQCYRQNENWSQCRDSCPDDPTCVVAAAKSPLT